MINSNIDGKKSFLPFIIWGIGVFYFAISVVAASLYGILALQIQQNLHISPRIFASISSIFFLAYAFAQFVSGILLDRYNPKLVFGISAFIAAVGTFIFSISHSVLLAGIGQGLMGVGYSTSFIGAIYLAKTWFAPKLFGFLSGLSIFFMTIIVIVISLIVSYISIDFRLVMKIVAIVTLLMAFIMAYMIRRPVHSNSKPMIIHHTSIFNDLRSIVSNIQFWYATAFFASSYGVMMAWNNLFDIQNQLVWGHTIQEATILNCISLFAAALGGVIAGWLTDFLGKRAVLAKINIVLMLLLMMFLIYSTNLSHLMLNIAIFINGFFLGGSVLGFILVRENIIQKLHGTAFGLMTTCGYLVAALLLSVIGIFISNNGVDKGVKDIEQYKVAFVCFVVVLIIGGVITMFLNDIKKIDKINKIDKD